MAQQINFSDGPCKFLQNYLEEYKNLAPEHWANCRNIDEK